MFNLARILSSLPFLEKLDPETVELLTDLGKRAIASGDPNEYIKRFLRENLPEQVIVERPREKKP